MTFRDALSERMVIGIMLIGGFILLSTLIIVLLAFGKSIPETTAATILGVFGTAIGLIVGAVFRSDRVDQQRAETANTAVTALAAATPPAPPTPPAVVVVPAPTPPAPVEVTGPGGGPVQTEEATT